MRIQFRKGRDGRDVLACERADGSRTWAHLQPAIVTHDFVHFAVETTLGLRGGFWGLVASGWSPAAFEEPGTAAQLSEEASWTEFAVGCVWRESWGQPPLDVDELAAELVVHAANHGWKSPRAIGADELARIRTRVAELHSRWLVVEPGGTLELVFDEREPAKSRVA